MREILGNLAARGEEKEKKEEQEEEAKKKTRRGEGTCFLSVSCDRIECNKTCGVWSLCKQDTKVFFWFSLPALL